MKLNYEQMKEHFGIIFKYNSNPGYANIKEAFDTSLSYSYDQAETYEKALEKVKSELKKNLENALNQHEDNLKEYEKLSFIQKIRLNARNGENFKEIAKKRKEIAQNQYDKDIQNIKFEPINKDKVYEVNAPKIVKNGDEFYVVVDNYNVLDIGIYKAKAVGVCMFERTEGFIDLSATLEIQDNGQTHQFSMQGHNGEIVSGHTYHNIFDNKDEALKYYRETIQTRIDAMQKRIDNLDKVSIKM